MKHFKWSKFWWDDYEHDPRLKLCSFAAQGLWMRMLCIMHRASPRGYLHIDGDPISIIALAELSGKKFKETSKLFEELRNNKVFSVSDTGVAFSRKMVEQTQKTEDAVRFGKEGGNPNLVKTINGGVNPPVNLQEEEKKRREEEKDNSDASHRAPNGAAQPDLRSQAWLEGRRVVSKLTGMDDKAARSFVGTIAKIIPKDFAGMVAIFHEAERLNPLDPAAWMIAAAQARSPDHARGKKPEAFADFAETPGSIFVRRYRAGEIDAEGREISPPSPPPANDRGPVIDGVLA